VFFSILPLFACAGYIFFHWVNFASGYFLFASYLIHCFSPIKTQKELFQNKTETLAETK